MKTKGWLLLIIILLTSACASAPLGPFQYNPDDKTIKGYQKAGKALQTTINDVEVTVEPLDMIGLTKLLTPEDKLKEVGFIEGAQNKIANNMVFYVAVENKSKGQVMFNHEKARLIYEHKNWYMINTTEDITPLDFADFYLFLSKIKGGGDRLEVLKNNLFQGTTVLSPGQKKSGMIFFPLKEKDEDLIYLQLSLPRVYIGIESIDFAFTFKVVPVAAAGAAPPPAKK